MSTRQNARRTVVLLLSIALLVGLGCNLPSFTNQQVDLFPTPSRTPALDLLFTTPNIPVDTQTPAVIWTNTPPPTITPGGFPEALPERPEFGPAAATALPGGTQAAPVTSACTFPGVVPGPGESVILVYFHCGESLAAAQRLVPSGSQPELVRQALQALLAGPTAVEEAAGAASWFSSETAAALRSVTPSGGQLTIDLEDFSGLIPNAATAAGSRMLLDQISATVFQFPEYQSVLITFEGSCERFWNWLQLGCSLISRGP